MTEKDRELMETRVQIQKQLQKIVHRTWHIFDPEKKVKAKENYKAPPKTPSKNGVTSPKNLNATLGNIGKNSSDV